MSELRELRLRQRIDDLVDQLEVFEERARKAEAEAHYWRKRHNNNISARRRRKGIYVGTRNGEGVPRYTTCIVEGCEKRSRGMRCREHYYAMLRGRVRQR